MYYGWDVDGELTEIKKAPTNLCKCLIISCGEYRSRTDDLLHAMQAL